MTISHSYGFPMTKEDEGHIEPPAGTYLNMDGEWVKYPHRVRRIDPMTVVIAIVTAVTFGAALGALLWSFGEFAQ